MLESNHIPVVSAFGVRMHNTEQSDKNAEEPANEQETRVASVKDYIHEVTVFNFDQPVFILSVTHPVISNTNFPYCFYPDVPTPPPNAI